MVDLKKIDAARLRDSLWKIEPDLIEQVDPARMDACLTGACNAINHENKGRGR